MAPLHGIQVQDKEAMYHEYMRLARHEWQFAKLMAARAPIMVGQAIQAARRYEALAAETGFVPA